MLLICSKKISAAWKIEQLPNENCTLISVFGHEVGECDAEETY